MSNNLLNKLYTGDGGLDFVGQRRKWYSITAGIILVCLIGIGLRGFTLGIDFVGGTKMNMPAASLQTEQVAQTFSEATGVDPQQVQIVGAGDSRILEIASERLNEEQIDAARQALYSEYKPENALGEQTPDAIGDSTVSESWGSTITSRMLLAMGVFLAAVFVYIALRLERQMGVAAIVALMVDLVIISGIYAIVGFEVTPATVIGLLTVLAFSLYDTVIVFDKVRELTAGYLGNRRRTYGELANQAVNQTVMRSISTTVISALPIIALMVVAVWLMGVGTLKDLALVQLIGVIEGTFSSIFLATPILVSLKERNPKVKAHNAQVLRARAHVDDPEDEAIDEAIIEADERPQHYEAPPTIGATWRPGQG
ncbi:protein translocase subunit SecF [Corynebacterium gerontici]|uniref:Protein-export membrane protein SecF n=1 Tax=Corynebacterium gerontici TaxID=2079234 RepID=A0A3G6J169_9CORY|nr:preprotein translocase subunit SecF [Corynebacterium gerontici]